MEKPGESPASSIVQPLPPTEVFTLQGEWTAEELARKQELWDSGVPFRRQARQVMRCAECIFARETFEDESPTLTVPQINRCTGLDVKTIRLSITGLVKRSFLEECEETALTGLKPVKTYRPTPNEEGRSFLIASQRPGCKRSFIQDLTATLKPVQIAVLNHLMRYAPEAENHGYRITQSNVRDTLKAAPALIADMFRSLCTTGILEIATPRENSSKGMVAATYTLTRRGEWLLNQMPSLTPEAYLRVDERGAKEPLAVDDLQPRIIDFVEKNYPPEVRGTVLETLIAHLNLGVLRGGITSKNRPGYQNRQRGTGEIYAPGRILAKFQRQDYRRPLSESRPSHIR